METGCGLEQKPSGVVTEIGFLEFPTPLALIPQTSDR